MEINKDDWYSWKNSPVTKKVFEAIIEEIQNEVASLVSFAGLSQTEDRYKAGKIKGLQLLIDWEPDFPKETTDGLEDDGA